jgi:hypothetical protein
MCITKLSVTKVEGDAELVLGPNLIKYLRSKLGMSCSDNHSFHAEQAHRRLEDLIKVDVEECSQQELSNILTVLN